MDVTIQDHIDDYWNEEGARCIEEFFAMLKYRRMGVGLKVATQLFDKHLKLRLKASNFPYEYKNVVMQLVDTETVKSSRVFLFPTITIFLKNGKLGQISIEIY